MEKPTFDPDAVALHIGSIIAAHGDGEYTLAESVDMVLDAFDLKMTPNDVAQALTYNGVDMFVFNLWVHKTFEFVDSRGFME